MIHNNNTIHFTQEDTQSESHSTDNVEIEESVLPTSQIAVQFKVFESGYSMFAGLSCLLPFQEEEQNDRD
jgi:hypothetical protein